MAETTETREREWNEGEKIHPKKGIYKTGKRIRTKRG